ncbi:MAG: ABC transporter permease [Vicinamibacteria bacterium]|nr:ABC transporter permease [Vicinamibacteria bacterium]
MRAYRLLLRLFPKSFRHEYGGEMSAIFAKRRREAAGAWAVTLLWLETIADTVRDACGVHADLLRQDVGYATRTLLRAKGFAVTSILVMALGVGATTAVFSVADHVLVRPLPFPESTRLVKLWQDDSFRGYSRLELSPAKYRDWKQMATAFSRMAAFTPASMNLTGAGLPERLEGVRATTDLFSTLSVPALLGRTFLPTDAQGPRPVVLGAALWNRLFSGDPNVLGRTVILDETPHVIVGVMPPSFDFPSRTTEFWTTLEFDADAYEDRGNTFLQVIARLAPDVTVEQARAELRLVAAQLERQYPEGNAKTSGTVVRLRDELGAQARLMLLALAGASLCLLLIACMNLAHLLIARALGRRRELAVRVAIGAAPERLVRQLLTESLLVTGCGGVLGVLIAIAATPLIARLVPTSLPIAEMPAVDLRLLGLAAMVTLATSMAFGVFPAVRVARSTRLDALRETTPVGPGRATERLRSGLVVAEIAASVVLLVAAGLLMRALWNVQQVDPGFRTDGVLTMRTALPWPAYQSTARREQFFDRVLTDIRALPAVQTAAYISFLPMVMRGGIWSVTPEGQPDDPAESRMVSLRLVTPGFFDTMQIPLRLGRDVRAGDKLDPATPLVEGVPVPSVAVVSDAFVRDYLPGRKPLGQRFRIGFLEATIVGVVGDIRVRGLERDSEPQVYLPSAAVPDGSLINYTPKDLVIRTAGSIAALAPAVRRIVERADAQQPVSDVRTLSDVVQDEMASRRSQLRVLAAFSGLAVLLAGIGIHGLLAFVVTGRGREIAVRMALGAGSGRILRLILGRGLALAGYGVVLGLAGAYAAGESLQALLAGVSPTDLATFGAAAGLALAMAVAGSLWPALGAMRVDPVSATRTE